MDHLQDTHLEITQLRQELTLRDRLVQQLSQELCRLIKDNAGSSSFAKISEDPQTDLRQLQLQLQNAERQGLLYQAQLIQKDQDIHQLQQSIHTLNEHSRKLEEAMQELPEIYRQKFSERMAAVRVKVEKLQRENRQLHAELQSVSYCLEANKRRNSLSEIELPTFNPTGSRPIPTYGSL